MSQKYKPKFHSHETKPTYRVKVSKPENIVRETLDRGSQIKKKEDELKAKEKEIKDLKELKKLEDKQKSLLKWAKKFDESIEQKKNELKKKTMS